MAKLKEKKKRLLSGGKQKYQTRRAMGCYNSARIEAERLDKQLSDEELAAAASIHPSTWRKFKLGGLQSEKTAKLLAAAVGLSLESITLSTKSDAAK